MRSNIFLAIHYLEIGGAETSLIGLLQALDYSKYDVDLFLYSHRGELIKYIPKEVNLLPEIPEYAQIERPLKEVVKDGYWRIAMARLWAKWRFRSYYKKKHPRDGSAIFGYVAKYVTPKLPSLRQFGEYDLAISYLTPHSIVLEKVAAKKKIAWIHTDYSRIDVDTELELPIWTGYDHIVSISNEVTVSFLKAFPSLSEKIVMMENILSPGFVKGRADEVPENEIRKEMPVRSGETTLLSVGRFSHQKNYDNVPEICRRILASGERVRWYLIGFGGDEPLIRRKIEEAGMQDYVLILGKKENPYPYIKACDIYVQPSRYEGNAVTVHEAQILCKPVIITNYPTSQSQLTDGVDGVIVPMDNQGCAEGIVALIHDHNKRKSISDYLGNIEHSVPSDTIDALIATTLNGE